MAAKLGVVFATFAAAVFLNLGASNGIAADASDVPITFALFLDGKDAIQGHVDCQIYMNCRLLDGKETGVQLSVTLDSKQYLAGDVSVHCGEPACSFLTWKTTTRLESGFKQKKAREFDLYAGENSRVQMDLVQRTRTRIGEILILFDNREQ
jgi:hypothetical protein